MTVEILEWVGVGITALGLVLVFLLLLGGYSRQKGVFRKGDILRVVGADSAGEDSDRFMVVKHVNGSTLTVESTGLTRADPQIFKEPLLPILKKHTRKCDSEYKRFEHNLRAHTEGTASRDCDCCVGEPTEAWKSSDDPARPRTDGRGCRVNQEGDSAVAARKSEGGVAHERGWSVGLPLRGREDHHRRGASVPW